MTYSIIGLLAAIILIITNRDVFFGRRKGYPFQRHSACTGYFCFLFWFSILQTACGAFWITCALLTLCMLKLYCILSQGRSRCFFGRCMLPPILKPITHSEPYCALADGYFLRMRSSRLPSISFIP